MNRKIRIAKYIAMTSALTILASCSTQEPGSAPAAPEKKAKEIEFFVSENGNDANPGTAALPFATLEKARDRMREIRKSNGIPADTAPVISIGGRIEMSSSFKLTEEDYGTSTFPLVFRSYGPGKAVLTGGKPVSNFKPVADQETLKRFRPEVQGKILQSDLKEIGITDYGSLSSRGFTRPIAAAHMELFIDNAPMTLARYPNEGGYLKIAGYGKTSSDEWKKETGDLKEGFFYKDERPKSWKPSKDIWAHGFWSWDWANSVEHVESIDPEKGFIKTSPPYGLYNFRNGQRFFFLNVLEELDVPGEFFVDREKGMLYLLPPAGKEKATAYVSVLKEPVISIKNTSNILIENLVIECGRSSGISIAGGKNITAAGCEIRNLGNRGIDINGGTGHSVVSCDVYNTGDGGISVQGGNRKTLTPAGHVVSNCHIHHIGRWSKCYQAGISMSGVGITARSNLIHDGPHNAILFNGNDMTIENNEIHSVCLESGDVGAIYTGRDYTFRGNRILFNFIHDIGGVGMGSMGIYMDDCVSGTEIRGNILRNCTRAVFLGGGRDFKVENNIFIDCKPAIQIDGRGIDKNPVWSNMVKKYMKERLDEMKHHQPPYSTRYPEIATVDKYYEAGNGIPPENILIRNNICAGGEWLKITWNAKPECARTTDNIVEKDPGFVDAEKGTYLLKDGSPALQTGFKQIPVEKIGLQKDKYRK